MKPIETVRMMDKDTERTLNTLFEDLYNRVVHVPELRTGKLNRPLIDSAIVGTEYSYAFCQVHCTIVPNAAAYCWSIRLYGTMIYTDWFSTSENFKFLFLNFNTQYEIRVRAIGIYFIMSDWSPTTLVLTPSAPKPSKVTNIVITNEPLYVDPTTGITLASIKIQWQNNPDNEFVDTYETLWEG